MGGGCHLQTGQVPRRRSLQWVRVWRFLGGEQEIKCKKKRVNFPSTFLAEDMALISGGYQAMR